MGSTLNSLSEGRFALGLAKGVGVRWKAMNVDFPTFEREAEFIQLMRKLWRGERELNHTSALGTYPALQLAHYVNEDILFCTWALALTAFIRREKCTTEHTCTLL